MLIVLIIGCLFGFGQVIVCIFFDCGWQVVVIMCMFCEDLLLCFDCLCVLLLDVIDFVSIEQVLVVVGLIDVLVNNVGFGVVVLLELMLLVLVCELFEINMIGMMVMSQVVFLQFCVCCVGVIVNVIFSVMLKVLLLVFMYSVSKVVMNVFIELMVVELVLLGICVYLVLLGCLLEICFVENVCCEGLDYEVYVLMVQQVFVGMCDLFQLVIYVVDVVEVVWCVVIDLDMLICLFFGEDVLVWVCGG